MDERESSEATEDEQSPINILINICTYIGESLLDSAKPTPFRERTSSTTSLYKDSMYI